MRGLLFAAIVGGSMAGEPATAEYAFRWNPKDGGPATIEDVHRILGGKTKSVKEFVVRYDRVSMDKNWPQGAEAIFRERTKSDGTADYRLKFRRSTPFDQLDVCPSGMEASYEKDVTFASATSTRGVYSLSCTGTDPAIVEILKAKSLGCQAKVVRHEGKKYRLERWTLDNGGVLLEISDRSENTPAELARFGAIVDRLLRTGAKPSTTSKTDLAIRCIE